MTADVRGSMRGSWDRCAKPGHTCVVGVVTRGWNIMREKSDGEVRKP